MTPEEYLKSNKFQNPEYAGYDVALDDAREAVKMARKEEREKLTWHDLRKNPNDLPENFDVVIVCVKRVSGHTESLIGYNDGGIWFVEQEGEEPNVIAWMDIPAFK